MFDEHLSKQFSAQMDCARKSGIYDKTFLAFGSLLGYAREGGFIPHDDDMDIGILSDDISKEQIDDFIENCRTANLFKYRERHMINPVTGKHFWASCRMFPEGSGRKCCMWFMFNHLGYTWHCKGTEARIKGCRERYMEMGPEVEYLGVKVRIPRYTGALLDFWYPDWKTPRVGGTSNAVFMNVKDWTNKSTWAIKS